jgi:hypothetical protein
LLLAIANENTTKSNCFVQAEILQKSFAKHKK